MNPRRLGVLILTIIFWVLFALSFFTTYTLYGVFANADLAEQQSSGNIIADMMIAIIVGIVGGTISSLEDVSMFLIAPLATGFVICMVLTTYVVVMREE